MKFYIRGGIGDLLQHYSFIKENLDEEYLVHMHFKNAKTIFDQIGAFNCSFYEFQNADSLNQQTNSIINQFIGIDENKIFQTPRNFYSNFDFGFQSNIKAEKLINSFKTKKKIIGIHPFRSGFALSVYSNFDLPAKIIPLSITKEIISDDNNYLVFGSKKELYDYGLEESDNIKLVSFDNIFDSLNTVKYCNKLIGVDSCFKSMSSMQKIHTICLIGDFPDQTRDEYFIKKYEQDKIMKVFKTKNEIEDSNKIIEFFKLNT